MKNLLSKLFSKRKRELIIEKVEDIPSPNNPDKSLGVRLYTNQNNVIIIGNYPCLGNSYK
jgi:hypothetical protein